MSGSSATATGSSSDEQGKGKDGRVLTKPLGKKPYIKVPPTIKAEGPHFEASPTDEIPGYDFSTDAPVAPWDVATILLRDDKEPVTYGWGKYTPVILQNFCLTSQMLLAVLCVIAFLNGFGLNGVMESFSTQIQRRFYIHQNEMGLFRLLYYMGYVMAVVPIAYYGSHHTHKARWIAVSAFLCAIGSFVITIPHFLLPLQKSSEHKWTPHCHQEEDEDEHSHCAVTSGFDGFKLLFGVGYFIYGLGSAAPFTMGIVLMDENVSYYDSPLYVGIFRTCDILGIVFGYVVAGFCAQIPADLVVSELVDSVTYGAWWLPMICSGICTLIASFFMFGFPPQLVGETQAYERDLAEEVMDRWRIPSYAAKEWTKDLGEGVWDFVKRTAILVIQPTFIALTLERILTTFLLGGYSSFIAEYIQKVYRRSSSLAAFFAGGAVMGPGMLGVIGGTFIQYKLSYLVKDNLRWSLFTAVGCLLSLLAFSTGCSPPDFVGINYNITADDDPGNLTQSCNSHCHCDETYRPVCWKNGSGTLQFYSPCHAGCFNMSDELGSDCSCLTDHQYNTTGIVAKSNCVPRCEMKLGAFLIATGWASIFSLMRRNSVDQAMLRFVPFQYRLVGLCFITVTARLFGAVIAVRLYGYLLKLACLKKEEDTCFFDTQCLVYDMDKLTVYMSVTSSVVIILLILVCIAAVVVYNKVSNPSIASSKLTTKRERTPKT